MLQEKKCYYETVRKYLRYNEEPGTTEANLQFLILRFNDERVETDRQTANGLR